jgi:glutaredoxin
MATYATCRYCEQAQAARERTGLEYVCVAHRDSTPPPNRGCGTL